MSLDLKPDGQAEFVLDDLGKAIIEGQQTAEYLWQVPDDRIARARIVEVLQVIGTESANKGRREMPKICAQLIRAMQATASPQQVDLLQDGFHRLFQMWQAAKTGMV